MNATNKRVQTTAAGTAGNTLQAGADATINNSTSSTKHFASLVL